MNTEKNTGLTKDAGWEFGIRRTFPVTVEEAWNFLLSDEGMNTWLGKVRGGMEWEIGKSFKTADGVEGVLRVIKPLSHMRMTWKKKDWDHFSMLQPRVTKRVGKSVIGFHQDKLKDEKEREEMKKHWGDVIEQLEIKLNKTKS